MSVFDIYFTVDMLRTNESFFHKDRSHVGVDLVKKCFKQEMGPDSVVKYFSHDYQIYLKSFISSFLPFKKALTLEFKISGKEYFVILNNLIIENLLKEIKNHIKSYEQENMSNLQSIYKSENKRPEDYYILSVLKKMKENIKNNLSKSQVIFLLKIWEFLKNKKGFYDAFFSIFDKQINIPKETLDLFVKENEDILRQGGLFHTKHGEQSINNSQYCYLLMNTIDLEKNPLNYNTHVYIIKVFSVLVSDFDSLANVVLSDDYEKETKVKKLREEIYELYTTSVKKLFEDYVKFLKKGDNNNNEQFFTNLTALCLDKIVLFKEEDICVFKDLIDDLFMEYLRVLNRTYCGRQ